jgi:hypothetical protein
MPIPKRKVYSYSISLIILIIPLSLGLIYAHDNPTGITSLEIINSGAARVGTNVTAKGTITEILLLAMGPYDQLVHLSSPDGNITFFWTQPRLEVGWSVIVRGTVYQWYEIHPVFSVQRVILFT